MSINTDHLRDIKEIRSMMERSSRFISLSGLSGIFAGTFALIGAAVAYWFLQVNYYPYHNRSLIRSKEFLTFFVLDAAVVLILAVGFAIILTTNQAKKKGQKIWDNTSKRLLINLIIPLLAGGMFCIALLQYAPVLVAPAMLIFYGLALINGSKYTLKDIRYLGLLEIATGLVALLFPGAGLFFWAIGFGLLHIIYGTVMYFKYER